MSKSRDRKVFSHTAKAVKKINVKTSQYRGGIRL